MQNAVHGTANRSHRHSAPGHGPPEASDKRPIYYPYTHVRTDRPPGRASLAGVEIATHYSKRRSLTGHNHIAAPLPPMKYASQHKVAGRRRYIATATERSYKGGILGTRRCPERRKTHTL